MAAVPENKGFDQEVTKIGDALAALGLFGPPPSPEEYLRVHGSQGVAKPSAHRGSTAQAADGSAKPGRPRRGGLGR